MADRPFRRGRITRLLLASVGVLAVVVSACGLGVVEDLASEEQRRQSIEVPAAEVTPGDETAPALSPPDPHDPSTTEHAAFPVADGHLEVHFLDVGQADATLLLHRDAVILIDQGDWRGDDVVDHLRRLAVERLDLVVSTHPHADHIGQFDQIMASFEVAEVWWPGTVHTTRTFERALAALEASTAAYEEPRAGDAAVFGPLTVEVANPDEHADFDDLHDAGLAVRITYGDVRLLFTGDIEAGTERRMVRRHPQLLAAQVLQLGHHGSSTSTSSEFLAAVDPVIAIHSAGRDNPYGHPHEEVVERLRRAGVLHYGTDVNGTIVFSTDGRQWSVSLDRPGRAVAGSQGSR